MKEHRLSTHDCLCCQGSLDAATCISEEAKPKPGDVTMCIYCGHMMAFAEDLGFRELNAEERSWCESSKLVQKALVARKATARKYLQ